MAEAWAGDYTLDRGLSRIDASLLAGLDVVILSSPRAAFVQQELDALKTFVENGGGLLVLQDLNPSATAGTNQVARLFGASFRSGALISRNGDWDAGSFQADVADSQHPVALGCHSFQMNWGSSIIEAPGSSVLLRSRSDTWQDEDGNRKLDTGEASGPLVVGAALSVGRGRVVLVADNSFHNNVWDRNSVLFMNAVRWLSAHPHGASSGATYSFDVDQDVTLDSVVQIGSGPQVPSTEIRFYPNTRRVSPGETVYWTLDLGGLGGPFTVAPELDNDSAAEPVVQTDSPQLVLPCTYAEPNIYVPFVTITDSSGVTRRVFTANVVYVAPGSIPQVRLGLDLPTVEAPVGDVIKGAILRTIDTSLLESGAGLEYVRSQIARWRADGINHIVLNSLWFTQRSDTPVQTPLYGNAPWPTYWIGTLSLGELRDLTMLLHAAGMRVTWRYELLGERDYTTSMRLGYAPSDQALYLRYQAQIKPWLAAAAEQAGADCFCLDTENPAFSLDPGATSVVESVRAVFGGVVCVNEVAEVAYRSAVNQACDLIYFSLGPVDFDSMKSHPASDLKKAFETQIDQQCRRLLYERQKPGLFDIFAGWDPADPDYEDNRAYQARAFEAILSVVAESESPLIGLNYHEVVLMPSFDSMWDPIGWPVESVIKEYFTEVIPDQRHASLVGGFTPPDPLRVIADFESRSVPTEFWLANAEGESTMATAEEESPSGDRCLHVHTLSRNTVGSFAWCMLTQTFRTTQDWTDHETLNFWMRSNGNKTALWVSVYDSDGDRFVLQLSILNRDEVEWVPYSISLGNLVHPDWAEKGNGVLNLERVKSFSVMEGFFDSANHDTWYDCFYLGKAVDWR
jgi:hypothetical protein